MKGADGALDLVSLDGGGRSPGTEESVHTGRPIVAGVFVFEFLKHGGGVPEGWFLDQGFAGCAVAALFTQLDTPLRATVSSPFWGSFFGLGRRILGHVMPQ